MSKTLGFIALIEQANKVVSGLSRAVQIWTSTRKWLGARRAGRVVQLAAAVDVPERRFMPKLRQQITRILSDDDFFESLENASKIAAPDISEIATPLARDLQIPTHYDFKRMSIAAEVAEALLKEMRRQQLSGEGALVRADELSSQRHQSIESKIVNLEGILSGQRLSNINDVLKKAEEMVKGKSRREVVGVWLATAKQLDGSGAVPEVRAIAYARLGLSQWNVGELAAAQAAFDRAYEISPSNREARTGRALALAFRKQFAEAEALLVDEGRNGEPVRVAGVLAQVLLYKSDYAALDELIAKYGIGEQSSAVMRRVYATSLLHRRRAAEAVRVLTQYGAPGPDGDNSLLLGSALVGDLTARVMAGTDPAALSAELERTVSILDSAADLAYRENNPTGIFEAEVFLALAERMRNKYESAHAHLNKAIQHADDSLTLSRVAFMAAELGAFNIAESLLLRIPIQELVDEALALLIDCAWHVDRNAIGIERARAYIIARWPKKTLDEIPLKPFLQFVEVLARAGVVEEALGAVEARLKAAQQFSLLVMRAKLMSMSGDVQETRTAALAALASAEAGQSSELWQLARLLMQLEMFEDCIRALDLLGVNQAGDERRVRLLAEALYQTNDPRSEQRISELAKARPDSDLIQDVWIAVLVRRGDIDSAIEGCRKLIARERSSQGLLRLASLLARRDRIQECSQVIEEVRRHELKPEQQLALAGLLFQCGRFKDSIRAGAAAALSDWSNRQLVHQFAMLFLECSRHIQEDLKAESVDWGCVANVLVGQEERLVHFCSTPHSLPRTQQVGLTEPLGKAIYRKRGYEEVSWSEPTGVVRGVITQIREEHVYLFQLACEELAADPEASPAFFRVKVTPDLKEMKEILQARREQAEEAISFIKENPVPVQASSKLLHVDFVEAWQSLQEIQDIGIRTTNGDLSATAGLLQNATALLPDATGLLLLNRAGFLDLPGKCGFELQVSSQSFDFAVEASKRATHALGVEGTLMATREGRIVMSDINKDRQAMLQEDMERLLIYLQVHAVKVPMPRSFDVEETEMTELMGGSAIASAVIAQSKGKECVPLVDDAVCAAYLRDKYGVSCVGTVDLIRYASMRGIIGRSVAADALLPLAAGGFRGILLPGEFFTEYVFSVRRNLEIYKRALRATLNAHTMPLAALSAVVVHLNGVTREAKVWSAVEPFVFACFDAVRGLFGTDAPARLVAVATRQSIIRIPNHELLEESLIRWNEASLV